MPKLHVIVRGGESLEIEGEVGLSVMEVIRDAGVDDLLAICSGCLSCATCHIYVDDRFAGLAPPMSADEDDLLSSVDSRGTSSRLSCQIPFTDALDGMIVTIPPE